MRVVEQNFSHGHTINQDRAARAIVSVRPVPGWVKTRSAIQIIKETECRGDRIAFWSWERIHNWHGRLI